MNHFHKISPFSMSLGRFFYEPSFSFTDGVQQLVGLYYFSWSWNLSEFKV